MNVVGKILHVSYEDGWSKWIFNKVTSIFGEEQPQDGVDGNSWDFLGSGKLKPT